MFHPSITKIDDNFYDISYNLNYIKYLINSFFIRLSLTKNQKKESLSRQIEIILTMMTLQKKVSNRNGFRPLSTNYFFPCVSCENISSSFFSDSPYFSFKCKKNPQVNKYFGCIFGWKWCSHRQLLADFFSFLFFFDLIGCWANDAATF